MNKMLIIFLILSSANAIAQSKFYTVNGGQKMSEMEMTSKADKMEEMLNAGAGKLKFVNPVIKDSIVKQDSIIYDVEFKIEKIKKRITVDQKPLVNYLDKRLLDFNLENLSGEKLNLENYAGKPTLINFWFTNCPPCIKELPLLNSLQEKYGDRFNFLAITFDSREKVQQFLENKEFDFDHLLNARSYVDELGISMYPVTIFLDKNGIVRFSERSFDLEKDSLQDLENEVMKKLSSLD